MLVIVMHVLSSYLRTAALQLHTPAYEMRWLQALPEKSKASIKCKRCTYGMQRLLCSVSLQLTVAQSATYCCLCVSDLCHSLQP
jgi:hypothetical protein